MNKYDKRYDIRLAVYEDIEAIMDFIDTKWKKDHILAKDRALFEYEFVEGNRVNMILAVDRKTKQIEGIFGFLPCSHTEEKKKYDIWGSLWMVDSSHENEPLLGIELAKRVYQLTGCRMHIGNGANPETTIPLRKIFFGEKTGKMKQYYQLNPQIEEYRICKIASPQYIDYRKTEKLQEILEIPTIQRLREVFDVESLDTYPYKDNWYVEKRFFRHPYYDYRVLGLEEKRGITALVVCRESEAEGRKILRIVDYMGDHKIFAETGEFWRTQMERYGYEYVDFYEFGMNDNYLSDAGFICRTDEDVNIIPNYFEPFLRENVDIWMHYKYDGTTFLKQTVIRIDRICTEGKTGGMAMGNVCIGMVGAGRAAELHMNALDRVSGISVRRKKIMARRPEQLESAKERYGFEELTYSFEEMLNDADLDVIDICTPPYTHADMVKRVIEAGKHVICEKPLTGYFGGDGCRVSEISKTEMYRNVVKSLDDLKDVLERSDRKFMYAENFVYAPAIVKAAEIIRKKKSRILYMKGEESLKGSSSPVAGEWCKTGGGSFVRVGTHPLTAILWLKEQEALAHGKTIHVESVMADMGMVTPGLTEYEHRHIMARPRDVEDVGTAILKFSDHSRAVVIAADTLLGGSKNYVELYCNDAAMNCTLTMNNMMDTYFLDEHGLDDVYLSEMLPSKTGWNHPFILDEIVRGYTDQMQDFMEAVYYDREPKSGFALACETAQVVYAAYASAETGRRWDLSFGGENDEKRN